MDELKQQMTTLSELSRFYCIVRVFLLYGLDDFIPKKYRKSYLFKGRYLLFWMRNRHANKPLGERFRLALQELGPVWIKFGQMLSTRRDLFSVQIADELALLQDQVPAFDGKVARELIEVSLGGVLETWFESFDETALASASIAQVHTARLKEDNSEVVVKVIRPDISETIHADIRLMYRVADLIPRFFTNGNRLRSKEVVREYEKTLLHELDLEREAANTIRLRHNFHKSPLLYIPKVYSNFSRHNVMVSERIYGISVSDIEALRKQGMNLKLLAERGLQVFFTQVFRDSFFHADMHPGNIFVSYNTPSTPQYIAIDCGIVGTLNREDKQYLAENFLAFFNRDYRKVAELHVDSGWIKGDIDVDELEAAIRTICEPIINKPLAEISYGYLLMNLFNTARRFSMEVQPQLVLLEKTLLYIEGLGRQLYPQLNLWETAKPFLEEWMKEQVGAKAIMRRMRENAPFWAEKLPELPNLVYNSLNQQNKLQQSVDELKHSLLQERKQQNKVFYLFGAGAALLLSATLLYINQHSYLSAVFICSSVLCWLIGWVKTK